ncbi:acyl-CoA dehydrogenase family protein [Flexibacterium corallicola]|uniref:acyl-CoA dehydrogenase family protein n=1 Tax=Flexibacterium corallicola TaxID=3037259 RepID=UPI00286F2665|nr:acyl-CoA dehydrogenase family protein [Pseudovibrio sp. M1P-2-3]
MDLNYTPEELAFRDEVREFLKEQLPASLAEKVRNHRRIPREEYIDWHSRINARGWLNHHWPVEFGGPGWNAVQKHIFDEELSLAHGPRLLPFGLTMLAPVIQAFGSKEQQDFFLPKILDGTHWWCQGYSEPQSGSDLASLKTRAVREGDHYIVNGQKTWTTLGHHANWIFCLVRTDPSVKAQEGISFLLIDMKTPGITVRPIKLIDGSSEVNEVFFDDVKVPAWNLVGKENEGWTYAKYLLAYERTGVAGVGYSTAALETLKRIARNQKCRGKSLMENPLFASKIAKTEIDLMAMRTTNLRVVAKTAAGKSPGVESSMLKIKGTEVRQEINDLMCRAVGPYAMPFASEAVDEGANEQRVGPEYALPATKEYLNNRKLSIYGGSNEIQRNIISKAIIRL